MITPIIFQPPKILIVDDVADNIQILHEVLKRDYEVYFATTGGQALELAHQVQPDLIILDIMLPDIDGYDVCIRLKQDPRTREIPVIFLTAMTEIEDETKGFETGAVDYLTKPIRPPIVRARVKTHVELKRQRDLLADLSTVDGLTGVRNRRRLDEYLAQEWGRARRGKLPLSLIMVDIDCFKAYNDNYGHAAGDECLKAVATAMARAMLRPADLVARYGGEEFACVMPETAYTGALITAKRLLEGVRGLNIPHLHSLADQFITISIGLAAIIPVDGLNPIHLIQVADDNLYSSKRAGRNRITAQDLITRHS